MNFVKGSISLLLFGIGILVGILEIIALIDPVGTKMSDDSDPFGNPYQPWYVHAAFILFTIACFGFGYFLARNSNSTKSNLK